MIKLVIILMVFLFAGCSASKADVIVNSENLKDGVFTNSHEIEEHSFWEVVVEGFKTERAVWPEWVETTADENPLAHVNGDGVRLTFINHATFLIQAGGFNILTDPVFSERTSPVSFAGPKRVHNPGINMTDLPKIDVILISHDHYDHLDLDTVNMLIERDNPKIFMGLGVSERLDGAGKTVEMDWNDCVHLADNFKLWFLEAQHFSGRSLIDRNTTLWGAFLMEIGGKKIYFGGDSGYAAHYKRTYERFGGVDVALLPIGAYAPRNMFKPIHLNPAEAVQAHLDLKAKKSIAMHHGTFQISAEARTEPVVLLKRASIEAGLDPTDFISLEVGQPYDLSATILATKQ